MLQSNVSFEYPVSQEDSSAIGVLLSACCRKWLRAAVEVSKAALQELQVQDVVPHSPYSLTPSAFWLLSDIKKYLRVCVRRRGYTDAERRWRRLQSPSVVCDDTRRVAHGQR